MAIKLSFPSKVEILSHISLHENGGYVLTPRNAWVLISFNLTILSLQRKRRRHCSKLFTDEKFWNIFSALLFCCMKIIWKQTSPPRGDEWAEEIPIPIKARLIRIRNREEYNQNKKGKPFKRLWIHLHPRTKEANNSWNENIRWTRHKMNRNYMHTFWLMTSRTLVACSRNFSSWLSKYLHLCL